MRVDIFPTNEGPADSISKVRKKRNTFAGVRVYFQEYCRSTSIHGFQYFGENRTIYEKIWWIVVFASTLSMCGYVIFLIYNKWSKSPLIVSLATEDTPIYQIPFPAVTLCPSIKYSHACLNFLDVLERKFDRKHVDEEEQKMFEFVFPFCIYGQDAFTDFESEEEEEENNSTEDEIYLFFKNQTITEDMFGKLLNCSPFMNESNIMVSFMGKSLEFNEVFTPIMTDEGICFTFNMLQPQDMYTEDVYIHPGFDIGGPDSLWIPQVGYSNDADLSTYPRRALLSGAANSLELFMVHYEKDNDCIGAERGYKIILHMPTRLPMPKMEYLKAPFNKVSSIAIAPHMMTTSEMVKSYAPEQRSCYFENEKPLKFFRVYSKTNCNVECIMNYTLATCGCVPFFMPRTNSTPICGLAKLSCVNKAKEMFNLSKLSHKLLEDKYRKEGFYRSYTYSYSSYSAQKKKKSSKHTKRDISNKYVTQEYPFDCRCLKMCNDISYAGAVSSLSYNWREMVRENSTDKPEFGMTHIKIFLQSNEAFTTERNELYGPTDFLSNFGGLLGLFTGFSILSFMEITYFCSIRIIGNLKLFGRWYGRRPHNSFEDNKTV